jgi:hypothetical protein
MMISAIQPDGHMQVSISLRPFVIPDDIRFVQQWVDVEVDSLLPFYESVEASSFMRSMMVWDNDQPIFQADMCEALFDDVGCGDAILPGDYTLRLLFSPAAGRNAIRQGLYNCMEYLFFELNASRILMPVYKSNKMLMDWVKAAHDILLPGIIQKPLNNLYILTRSAWQKLKRDEA